VRVRGSIEQRSGPSTAPAIELSTAGLLEVLDEPGTGIAPGAPPPAPPKPESKPPGLIETGR
jgi:hypothetical protein